ncbi:MAG: pentapeptide repeat-containing protein [Proteobacteria bacterium]|nr:pentapeptide repeat-containing protein [Pseudomonadota bacterium]MBU1388458.1 pentapeptide repeat-containing protein [Pseudomonadota bacterium]MBU1542718.1 pentapeptide repeat-containing protein [Pseudomonadota bacterium]MBU2431452.1 pentapeptide repeat-containing protein [Pseudomonadota bacterium]MBU2481252.1 pentapeptide repeat-containing protein [Pseudomonadota bacterium]
MEDKKHRLSQAEKVALRSRWDLKDPDENETVLKLTLARLKHECKKSSLNRPQGLDLRGITLFHEDLTNLDLSGYDLSWANLNRSDLTGTMLSYTRCHGASFEQAVLDECEFLGSDLTHASFNECSAKQCGFGGADLSCARMIHADLTDATLSHSKLVHSDLRAANLKNARVSEADLSHAIFTRAILSGADFKKSNVDKTNFELTDMQGCRLLGIRNFKTAKWLGADIRGLDLRGAYLVRRYIADENYLYEFKSLSRLHNAIYFVWWASSDCGRSLSRWFVWLFCVTLMFAAIYTQVEIDYGVHETGFSPVYFSFVTLTTLGYGDAVPASWPAQIFVTLQAISGYMGLGGLLSILGNKMARRAE